MAKFKEADIVYSKTRLEKGIISEVRNNPCKVEYFIIWENGVGATYTEDKLYTKKEYNTRNNF